MKLAIRLALLILFSSLAMVSAGTAGTASAQSGAASYHYIVGTSFLCGIDPSFCPDIAMASNGDTVEIRGEGRLSIHPKAASGHGTFVHKHGATVLGHGTWTATELLSFNETANVGLPGLPAARGGQAVMRVHLMASSGAAFDGILTISCDLGGNPPGHPEGVKLVVPGVANFNKPVGGATLFIKLP